MVTKLMNTVHTTDTLAEMNDPLLCFCPRERNLVLPRRGSHLRSWTGHARSKVLALHATTQFFRPTALQYKPSITCVVDRNSIEIFSMGSGQM